MKYSYIVTNIEWKFGVCGGQVQLNKGSTTVRKGLQRRGCLRELKTHKETKELHSLLQDIFSPPPQDTGAVHSQERGLGPRFMNS